MKKNIITAIIILLLFASAIMFIYYKNDKKVAVLGYHGILPREKNNSGDNLIVDQEKFEKQLKLLKKMRYETMSLEDFYCWKNGNCQKKHKSVLITFDDGYQNNYDYAFELLKKYDMKAVVFYVGVHADDYLGKTFMNLQTINKAHEKYPNIEFASHSYDLHHHGVKTYEIVDSDAKKMQQVIDTDYFAYPFGDYNDEYIRALKDNKYKMAFTFGPKREYRKSDLKDDNYKVPRLNISNDMSKLKFLLRLLLPL